jgi:fructokinase
LQYDICEDTATIRDAVILVAGEALYDLVPRGDGDLSAHPGGGPFNTARTIARLEQPVAFLGRLSSDRFGVTLERMLAEDGVALDAVVRTIDPTTLAIADVDAQGVARYRFYTQGTSAAGLTTDAALRALPEGVDALHVGTLGLLLEPVAGAVEAVVGELAARALVMVDPNIRPGAIADPAAYRARLERVLARTHVLKVSEEDLDWLALDARALRDAGPAVVLLTRGADGASVVTADGERAVKVEATEVVDTIGAGDAFGGGFLAWWRAQGLDAEALADTDAVVEAARFACLVAARTVARAGASPPRLAELGV